MDDEQLDCIKLDINDHDVTITEINSDKLFLSFMGCWNCYSKKCIKDEFGTTNTLESIKNDNNMNMFVILGDNAYPEKEKFQLQEFEDEKKLKYYTNDLVTTGLNKLESVINSKVKINETFKLYIGIGNHDIEKKFSRTDEEFFNNTVHEKDKYLKKIQKTLETEEFKNKVELQDILKKENITLKDLLQLLHDTNLNKELYNNYKSTQLEVLDELLKEEELHQNYNCFVYKKFKEITSENIIFPHNYYHTIIENNNFRTCFIMLDTNLFIEDEDAEVCKSIYTTSKNKLANNMMRWFLRKIAQLIYCYDEYKIDNIVIAGHHPILGFKKEKFDFDNYKFFKKYKFFEYLSFLDYQFKDKIVYICSDTHNYQDFIINKHNLRHIICGTGGAELDDIKIITDELIKVLKEKDLLNEEYNSINILNAYIKNIELINKDLPLNEKHLPTDLDIVYNKTIPNLDIEKYETNSNKYGYATLNLTKDSIDVIFNENN